MKDISNLTENEKRVVDFLRMLENRQSNTALAHFYHPDIEQIEYPNAITKTTAIRKLADLKAGADRGKQILSKEEYKVVNIVSAGETVVLECIWTGTLAIPVGKIEAGSQMKAYFAQVFEFKEGKIFKQRNYDCFEPF